MKKTIALMILILFMSLILGGCWNYRGLNEMVIVAGVAIDKNPENGNYKLTFEIMDVSKPLKEEGLQSMILESEGKTIFDAARNAKKRVVNKLYYGHMQVLFLSEEIAYSEDIREIIDWFLRDAEVRETICVVVSQEETAEKILKASGLGSAITSSEVHEIIGDDHKITASTAHIELYKVFNVLHCEGQCLTLSAVHLATNNEEEVVEVNGLAMFKDAKMCGYLSPEETKYFLYTQDEVEGGLFTFSSNGGSKDNVTLEISKNKTKRSFSINEKGEITVFIKTETTVYLAEINRLLDALNSEQIAELEKMAQTRLEKEIGSLIKKVQVEYGADIFGFGNMIYKSDPKLWRELKDSWDEQYKTLQVEVQSQIHIVNSAFLKDTVRR